MARQENGTRPIVADIGGALPIYIVNEAYGCDGELERLERFVRKCLG